MCASHSRYRLYSPTLDRLLQQPVENSIVSNCVRNLVATRARNMNLRFYMDPETGYPHIHRHGVEEYEVEDVLVDPGEDTRSRGDSRILIGQTRSGRYLLVVYRRGAIAGQVFAITAYELRGNALAAYRRRRRGS